MAAETPVHYRTHGACETHADVLNSVYGDGRCPYFPERLSDKGYDERFGIYRLRLPQSERKVFRFLIPYYFNKD